MAKRDLQLLWSAQMKKKFSEGADQKKEVALKQERKRLVMLEILKKASGSFTDAKEVSSFMQTNV